MERLGRVAEPVVLPLVPVDDELSRRRRRVSASSVLNPRDAPLAPDEPPVPALSGAPEPPAPLMPLGSDDMLLLPDEPVPVEPELPDDPESILELPLLLPGVVRLLVVLPLELSVLGFADEELPVVEVPDPVPVPLLEPAPLEPVPPVLPDD